MHWRQSQHQTTRPAVSFCADSVFKLAYNAKAGNHFPIAQPVEHTTVYRKVGARAASICYVTSPLREIGSASFTDLCIRY